MKARKRVGIEIKELAFFSRDFAVRPAAERGKFIEKACEHLKSMKSAQLTPRSPQRYINDVAVVAETGESANHVYSLDTDKIEADGWILLRCEF